MAARAASHGSSLRQTGEAAGEPGRDAGRKMGSQGCQGLGSVVASPASLPELCWTRGHCCALSIPREAPVGSGHAGAPRLPPPECAQPQSWEQVSCAGPAALMHWAWFWQRQRRV